MSPSTSVGALTSPKQNGSAYVLLHHVMGEAGGKKGVWAYIEGTILYRTVLYCTEVTCTLLYCPILYCTVLYCTILYRTVLYCTELNCTVLSTAPTCQFLFFCFQLHYEALY